jgi:hypothetical protein
LFSGNRRAKTRHPKFTLEKQIDSRRYASSTTGVAVVVARSALILTIQLRNERGKLGQTLSLSDFVPGATAGGVTPGIARAEAPNLRPFLLLEKSASNIIGAVETPR